MNIGDKLRKIREERDYSQEYLATKLQITQPSYARIENGCTRLSTERLQKIAEVLNIRPEFILNCEDKHSDNEQTPVNSSEEHTGPDNERTIELLVQEIRDLREERNRLLNIIERFSR